MYNKILPDNDRYLAGPDKIEIGTFNLVTIILSNREMYTVVFFDRGSAIGLKSVKKVGSALMHKKTESSYLHVFSCPQTGQTGDLVTN